MKKFLLLLFVVTTCFACRDNDAGISPSNGEKGKFGFVPREMGLAIEYYQSVLNSFRGSRSSDAGGALAAKEYPENYGGAYINDQNKLVILVPTSQLATRTKYRDILGHTNFIIEPCEFSYRQLLEVRDSLVEAVFTNPKYPEVKENVVSIAVKDKENEIEVGLLDCSEARISEFKGKILDSPVICFRETSAATMDSAKELIPGEKVSTDRNIERGIRGSLGYRVKDNKGNIGVVVSAHIFPQGGLVWYDLNNNGFGDFIGSITKATKENRVDAAFCELDEEYYSMGQYPLDYGEIYESHEVPWNLPVGSYVYMVGHVSGRSFGGVTSSSVDYYFKSDGVTLYDLMQTSYHSDHGDSGGAVFLYFQKGTGEVIRYVVGVHENHDRNYSYCVKAHNINNDLGLIVY